MKRILSVTLFILACTSVAWADGYRYISAADLKNRIETDQQLILLDIQEQSDFSRHHIDGAVATFAYPVKSQTDKAKLEPILIQAKASDQPVVIVCPRGGGGAKRAYDYLQQSGIAPERLLILEGGQHKWPYRSLLKTG